MTFVSRSRDNWAGADDEAFGCGDSPSSFVPLAGDWDSDPGDTAGNAVVPSTTTSISSCDWNDDGTDTVGI